MLQRRWPKQVPPETTPPAPERQEGMKLAFGAMYGVLPKFEEEPQVPPPADALSAVCGEDPLTEHPIARSEYLAPGDLVHLDDNGYARPVAVCGGVIHGVAIQVRGAYVVMRSLGAGHVPERPLRPTFAFLRGPSPCGIGTFKVTRRSWIWTPENTMITDGIELETDLKGPLTYQEAHEARTKRLRTLIECGGGERLARFEPTAWEQLAPHVRSELGLNLGVDPRRVLSWVRADMPTAEVLWTPERFTCLADFLGDFFFPIRLL